MSEDPEAQGGASVSGTASETVGAEGQTGAGTSGAVGSPLEPGGPQPAEWWRRDTGPAGGSGEAPVSDAPPPSGTPQPGAPQPATPPAAAPSSGAPQPGAPPGSIPPWGGPPWGGPPWGWLPQWAGWGPGEPGWPGGAPSPAPPARRQPLSWVIVGSVVAAIAMVALGLGIGYSVWGTGAPAVARNGAAAPAPAPRIEPPLGHGGFLGVEVVSSGTPAGTSTSPTPSVQGAQVVGVVPSSPAAKAGIAKGDVITEFATRRVRSARALGVDVLGLAPGRRVKVGWTTPSGAHKSATVTLAKRPTTASIG